MTFLADRPQVLEALYVMGAASCAWSRDGVWAQRCDCKYGVRKGKWPIVSENGSGCPELRSLYDVLEAMTDDEWALLSARAGGIPAGMFAATETTMQARLVLADSAAAEAERHLRELRVLLTLEPEEPDDAS